MQEEGFLTGNYQICRVGSRASNILRRTGIVARMCCHKRIYDQDAHPLAKPRSGHSHMGGEIFSMETPADLQRSVAFRYETSNLGSTAREIVIFEEKRGNEGFHCRKYDLRSARIQRGRFEFIKLEESKGKVDPTIFKQNTKI